MNNVENVKNLNTSQSHVMIMLPAYKYAVAVKIPFLFSMVIGSNQPCLNTFILCGFLHINRVVDSMSHQLMAAYMSVSKSLLAR